MRVLKISPSTLQVFHLCWKGAKDDLEVKKKMFSKIPLDTIRIGEIMQVLDQVKEDSNLMQPKFEKVKDQPIQLPDWSEPEIDDLDILARPVLKFTRHWVDRHIKMLKEGNVHLSYQLMGSLNSHSEATEGSSQAQAEEGEVQ